MADTSQDTPRATAPVPVPRRRVLAWALWDWGSAAFQAVITTFVFTRWITSDAFVDPATVAAAEAEAGGEGPANALLDAALADHSAWLGWGLAGAGVLIALLAPVTGSSADRTGRRKRWLGVHTAITVLISISMFFVTPDPASLEQNLLLGIFLLAVGHVFFELAGVNYNAMLAQVSTPGTVGKVSGIGWGAGYVGGIVLLLILFVGFIDPDVGWFGVTSENGLDIRAAVLVSAIWFGISALPVFFAVPELPVEGRPERRGVVAAYRSLAADVVRLWRTSRPTVRFLVASAVYRDGLSGVFVFGAIIASTTFGFSAGQVIQFAIAANVVAGLATIAAGWLDDRIGPKAVVVGSLVGLVVAGTAVFLLHDAGQGAFWVFGLLLCVFVGPAQSASRSLLARLSPEGHESELFGLYATTGRAAGFLASFAFSTTIAIAGEQYWGVLGIMAVLLLGLVLLLPVKVGGRDASGSARPSGSALGDAPDGAR
ncbi:MFS transporter [Cellulomonas sp. 179-A 4D5 NHS]|uniref:MFS transporter n=1 Tax=Cellulomonas sp. 179-A 4D5 NHS TaxID=3142378 RepID=UPI0039A154CE